MSREKTSRPFDALVWAGLFLVIATVVVAFIANRAKRAQPPPPVYGQVTEFTLTNQNHQPVTAGSLLGQVWVADIIFSRCAGPCPEMTRKMGELQSALPATLPVRFVTLTTDPGYDSPDVLRRYGEKFGADPGRWLFLTGAEGQIYKLAVEQLKLTAIEKKPEERESAADLFIHSTIFVVVDRKGQLRGVFESTGEGVDWTQVKQELLAMVERLSRNR